MAPAIPTSTCSSEERHHTDSDSDSPVLSPMICQCENQLAHWDWAGRWHPNLPECCRPAGAMDMSYIPRNDNDDESLHASDFNIEGDGKAIARVIVPSSYSPEEPKKPKELKESTDEQQGETEGNNNLADRKTEHKRKREESSASNTCKKSKHTSICIKKESADEQQGETEGNNDLADRKIEPKRKREESSGKKSKYTSIDISVKFSRAGGTESSVKISLKTDRK